jgi:hypothetical protein
MNQPYSNGQVEGQNDDVGIHLCNISLIEIEKDAIYGSS